MMEHTKQELRRVFGHLDRKGLNKLLVSKEIENPNQTVDLWNDGAERPLLTWACEYSNIAMIEILVKKHRANVNLQDSEGLTPLHYVVKHGKMPILRFLVEECRPNFETRDADGVTPLYSAWLKRRKEMVAFLCEKGADVNAMYSDKNLLHLEALHGVCWGVCSIAQILLADKRIQIDAFDDSGRTPLGIACRHDHLEMVRLLLSKGANPNAAGMLNGVPRSAPIIAAAGLRNTNCIQALIEFGADMDIKKWGRTALHVAVHKGYTDVVKLLLNGKADWSETDEYNRTPLQVVTNNHKEAVESVFVETLSEMAQQQQVREIFLCGSALETCPLFKLPAVVHALIVAYHDAPTAAEAVKIRRELNRYQINRKRKLPSARRFQRKFARLV